MVRAGVPNTVATCGTALGEGHFRLASRFAQRMVLAFDSDDAGARAAERAFEFVERFPVQPVVLILPEGLDPADFVDQHGGETLRVLAGGAVPLVEYMVRRTVGRHDLSTIEGRARRSPRRSPCSSSSATPCDRASTRTCSPSSRGSRRVPSCSSSNVSSRDARSRSSRPSSAPRRRSGSSARCCGSWLDDVAYRSIAPCLSDEHFRSSRNRQLMALIREADGRVSGASSEGGDDEVVQALTALALEPLDGDQLPGYPEEVWARLQEFLLRRRSVALRQELQKMNP